ncbi:hypothetical protein CPB84DRAFT_1813736 [Gymnopilus junonius]|uniref:SAM domain-containing protein n=1 Tax=Gymnopilus junonius TaxID=109634 RepID=A0A9P5NWA1_GYMJU|nr:hypothetical protein CPB84DRAFT_1813736 [Gymnopilus junonius]
MSTIEFKETPQVPVAIKDVDHAPASGQANGAQSTSATTVEGFDRWIKDFQKYESILNEMAKVNADTKFKDELATIEKWFKVLNESERTAAIYALLQHSTQDQVRFFVAVLQQMIRLRNPRLHLLGKLSFRPPSLNLPDHLDSPVTPTPVTARESAIDEQSHENLLAQATLNDMVNTPVLPLYQKDKDAAKDPKAGSSTASLPGFSGINPYTLNMLANAGLSTEAQLLAAQLVMSGLVQPTGLASQPSAKPKKSQLPSSWRTPTSARYPASALRSSGLRPSSSLKSAGLKSSALAAPATPVSALETPREEDFVPEMLNDIPGWLRGLRLHKYTQCFEGLSWQEIVVLDDATLENKGVAALGARRRLLRTFEHVRKRMGMEEPTSATPTTSAIPTGAALNSTPEYDHVPHSALPRSKLSINSPIFTPTWDTSKVPQSASPAVSVNPIPPTTKSASTTTTAE